MKKEQPQKQLDERKEQQSRAAFEQGKKEMLTQLKDGSGGGDLRLKVAETKLMLKSGNVPKNDPCAGRENELQQAKQRITELEEDVKTMQFALKLYRDGLLQITPGAWDGKHAAEYEEAVLMSMRKVTMAK